MATSREWLGDLVTPDPRLTHIYLKLGGSIDTSQVSPKAGGKYTCPSVSEFNDDQRHLSGNVVVACSSCVPVGGTRPVEAPPARTDTQILVGEIALLRCDIAELRYLIANLTSGRSEGS